MHESLWIRTVFCKMRNVKILACKEPAYTLTRVTGASHVTSNRIICILKVTQQCSVTQRLTYKRCNAENTFKVRGSLVET